jgi:hypothetical protein
MIAFAKARDSMRFLVGCGRALPLSTPLERTPNEQVSRHEALSAYEYTTSCRQNAK